MATVWERLRTRAKAVVSNHDSGAKWVQPSNSVTRSIYDPIEAELALPLDEPARTSAPHVERTTRAVREAEVQVRPEAEAPMNRPEKARVAEPPTPAGVLPEVEHAAAAPPVEHEPPAAPDRAA